MKVTSHECPLCGAGVKKTLPAEMMVEKTVYFDCGTIISWYPALVQVTTPCRPCPQWIKRPKRIAAIQARAEGQQVVAESKTPALDPITPAHGVFPIPTNPKTSLTSVEDSPILGLSAPTDPEEDTMADTTLTAKQAATKLGTDARTLRKFFRATPDIEAVGRGGKYEIDAKELPAIRKAFKVWEKDETKKAKARAAAKAEKAAAKKTAPVDDIEEPTDDDLEDLDLD